MLISVALGSFGSGYDLIFFAGCWVLLALAQGKKCHLWVFLIMFASYSATDLMFGVLICLHVDFCGTWILWHWL